MRGLSFRIRALWQLPTLTLTLIHIKEQLGSPRGALRRTVGVGCGLVVHGGEQPVTLLGLGLPEETPVVTVDGQPQGTHSR